MAEPHQKIPFPWQPTARCRATDDAFFHEGNLLCSQQYKYMREVSETDDEDACEEISLPCHLPGCTKSFSSIASYELHYNTSHRHVCQDCRRTFPSAHLLEIHILEWHDVMFDLLAAKQNMYQCLVETCSHKFPSALERKTHLVSCHKYPASFRFHRQKKQRASSVVADVNTKGQNGRKMNIHATAENMEVTESDSNHVTRSTLNSTQDTSQLSHPSTNPVQNDAPATQSSQHTMQTSSMEADKEDTLDSPQKTDAPVPGRSFLYKIPKNITFGQGVQRSFHRQRPQGKKKPKKNGHWHQVNKDPGVDTTVNIEEVDMADLSAVLDNR